MALLIDGHCHQVLAGDIDRAGFELACSEADLPAPPGVSYVDSQLGVAVRRWCPPVLGLPAGVSIDDYLTRRLELGWSAATEALLGRAGLAALLVDTGLDTPDLVGLPLLQTMAAAPVHEVVRLERVAEHVIGRVTAAEYSEAFASELAERVSRAVAVKSIIAYRHGLAIPADRPSAADVAAAARQWRRVGGRLTDPVLLRHGLWAGVDTGLPVQLHTGFGDRDVALSRADPALAQPFIDATRSTGTPIVLLHTYPYQRSAGWLAQVYPHVYLDLGLTVGHLGLRSDAVLAEFFELAPFGKVLFSTDAYGLAELYLVGAAQFRHSLQRLLAGWVADDAMTAADAARLAEQVGGGNARRVYGI
ncbi:MAG: amidohydrolase family protein [Micromonosporaceae bacterium]